MAIAQVFPPDFGKPKLNVQPIALPEGQNVAPSSVTVSASSNVGAAGVFTFTLRDSNGWNDLKDFYLLINNNLAPANSCFLHFDLVRRTAQLANDRADAWTQVPTVIGGVEDQLLSNSQCTVMLGSARLFPNLNGQTRSDLVLQLSITFSPTFSGARNFYTLAEDLGGLSKPWGSNFTFTGIGAQSPLFSNGFAMARNFRNRTLLTLSATLSDANGWNDLTRAYLLINDRFSATNGCLLEVDLQNDTVRLANDAATDWLPIRNRLPSYVYDLDTPWTPNVSNASCALGPLSLAISRTGYNLLGLSGRLQLLNFSSGVRRLYLFAEDKSGANTGWAEVASATAPNTIGPEGTPDPSAGRNAPTIGNTTPPEPSGRQNTTETLAVTITDLDKVDDLSLVYLLVNTSQTGAGGCLVEFDPASGKVRLATNDATGWVGASLTLGAAGTLENGQCIIHGPGSSYVASFNYDTLSLNLKVQTKASFAGARAVYGYAVDRTDRNSGWVALGQWNIPGPVAPTVSLPAPQLFSQQAQISLVVSDRNGSDELQTIRFVLGSTAAITANSCALQIHRTNSTGGTLPNEDWLLVLADDAGQLAGRPGLAPFGAGEIANGQCAVRWLQVTTVGNALVYDFVLRLQPAYAGRNQTAFVMAADRGGLSSNWASGPPLFFPQANAPNVARVTSSNPGQPYSRFDVEVQDADGPEQTMVVDLLLSDSTSPTGACWASYQREHNSWRLNDEAGNALQSATFITGAADAVLRNSRCRLLSEGSSAFTTAPVFNGLTYTTTISFQMHFLPAFAGTRTVFARVSDRSGLSSGWQSFGSYTSPPASSLPPLVSVFTSSSGSGVRAELTANFWHDYGPDQLRNGYVIVNSTLSPANGCFLWLDFSNGMARLANPAGTAWSLPGVSIAAPGIAPAIGNSNCEVVISRAKDRQNAAVFGLTFFFKNGFAGPKRVYSFADTIAGANSGWKDHFAWSIPETAGPVVVPFDYRIRSTVSLLTVAARHDRGVQQLRRLSLSVGQTQPGVTQCRAEYRTDTRQFGLYNNLGTALVASGAAGENRNLENGFCTLRLGNSSTGQDSPTDPTLWAKFDLTLHNSSPDIYAVFGQAEDLAGQTTDWRALGTWASVGPVAPLLQLTETRLTPIPEGGYDASFALRVEESNGLASLKTAYLLVRDGDTTANACFVSIDLENRLLRLAADSGQAWIDRRTPLAASGLTLANSQCALTGVTLSAEFPPALGPFLAGQILVNLRFPSHYKGNKKVEAFVEDNSGLNSRWLLLRGLALP